MSILLLIAIRLCSMYQTKCYFGRSETFVKQYQGAAKSNLGTGYAFPGGKSSHNASRESTAVSARWEIVLSKSHHILNNCSCWVFYIDKMRWQWCIGTSCTLDVSWRGQGAGKRGTGEQAGAVFAEASGRGPRRCREREGRWVQWTTSAVAQGRGGSRSWRHSTPRVGWTGNGCDFNSWTFQRPSRSEAAPYLWPSGVRNRWKSQAFRSLSANKRFWIAFSSQWT